VNVTSVSSALSFSRFFSETDPATMSEIAPEANAEDSTQSSGLLANTQNGAETETQCVRAFGAMGAGVGAIVGDVSAGPAGAWAGLQGGALVGSMVGGLTCGDVSQPLDTTFPAVGPDPAAMAPIDEPTDPAEGGAIASDAGAATATSKTEPDASVASPDATAPAPTPTGDNPTDSTITNPDETDPSQNASDG
jgi:hypothetical protein